MILVINGILGIRGHIVNLLPIIHIAVIVRILHLPFGEMLDDHVDQEIEMTYTLGLILVSIHVSIIDSIHLNIEISAVIPVSTISLYRFLGLPFNILVQNILDLPVNPKQVFVQP